MTRLVAPIGGTEDVNTEFKRADVLRNLEPVSRAVVSMLNASGGNVWIGVVEQNERWTGIEPIADVLHQKRRVEDHLATSVDPPLVDEVCVEPFELGPAEQILVVRVSSGRNLPYAQLKGEARNFVVRIGARSRPMTRDELARAFEASRGRSTRRATFREESDAAWKKAVADAIGGRHGRRELWVRAAFDPSLELAAAKKHSEIVAILDEWLRDPAKTGNRAMGWNFTDPYGSFVWLPGDDDRPACFAARDGAGETSLEVRLDGEITFRTPLARLEREESTLYPYALIEFPTSVVRLAAALCRQFEARSTGRVLIDVGLMGASGKKIRRGSHRSTGYHLEPRTIDADTVRAQPLEDRVQSLIDAPDDLAWRALTALYLRLGFLENQMPPEVYSAQHHRIHFPD